MEKKKASKQQNMCPADAIRRRLFPVMGCIIGLSAAPAWAQQGVVQFERDRYSVREDAGDIFIRVLRVGGSTGSISADFSMQPTSATGADLEFFGQTLQWADGDATPRVLGIAINNDTLVEGDEQAFLFLDNANQPQVIGTPSFATLTLIDDDTQPANGRFSIAGPNDRRPRARAVASGDLDNDNDSDVIVVYGPRLGAAGAVAQGDQVWLNDGNGGFSAGAVLGSAAGEAIALGDLDGDGFIDAVIGNGFDETDNSTTPDRIWWNNTNGGFTPGVELDSGADSSGNSVVGLTDVECDGDLDIVANIAGNRLRVYVNQGFSQAGAQGVFATGQTLAFSAGIIDFVLAPLPGGACASGAAGQTALHDLFVVLDNVQPAELWRNQGGTYVTTAQTVAGADYSAVAAGDLDGNGTIDLLLTRRSLSTTQAGAVALLNNAGVFSELPQSLPAAPNRALALADFDGDGDLDAAIGREGGGAVDLAVYLNNGNAAFIHSGQCLTDQAGIVDLTAADFNGDGASDLFIAALPDLLADGATPSPASPGSTALFNAAANSASCCAAEAALETFIDSAFIRGLSSATHRGLSSVKATIGALVDLQLLRRLRTQIMASRPDGQRLAGLYDRFSPEIVQLFTTEAGLRRGGRTLLQAWQPLLRDLLESNGDARISQQQIDLANSFLATLNSRGSTALGNAINTELARIGGLDGFVGQSIGAFADATLGTPRAIFANGFEE